MDKNAIGIAIHEIKQMVLVAIVAAETASDTDPRYFRLSESDTDLLSFSIFDIQERVTKLKDFSGATNAPDPDHAGACLPPGGHLACHARAMADRPG
jgi:hypothetical protein